MAIKETITPLKASNNATYKTVEGVTYFKLKSEFDGDYTKHCGLLGEEIDENFYFLRGYDIESISVDKDRNLIINRVDKDYAPLIVNIGEELGQPSFKFNKETGTITVTFPDGTINTMDGFLVEGKDIRIATDSTMDGNGTIYNPIRISPVEKTGTFAPADEYFDLTYGDKMPEGKGKGYRVVTKEKIDNFGCLYPFSAVKKIEQALKDSGSQWRVPSKEDWDELLNSFECAEYRNHSANTCTWLGDVAGRALKSYNLWDEYKTSVLETPTYGEDVVGLSIYPLGITPDRNEILNDRNNDAEGFGKIGGMWTSTVNEEGNVYVKLFGYNSGKVDQDTYGNGARMSIRLVKDYNYSNYNEIENILGFPYPTEMVYGIYEDKPYVKIWTKINLYSDAETLNGIRSDEWDVVTDSDRGVKTVYFINEWDGAEWHKKPLEDGDSVIIIERDERPYHEWRIINGELVDTAEALIIEFNQDFAEVKRDVATISATTNELVIFCGFTINTINEFSGATGEHINRLDGRIDSLTTDVNNFSAATMSEISRINDDIYTVSATTTSEISRVDGDISFVSGAVDTISATTTSEISRVDGDVSFVSGAVDTISAVTTSEISRVDGDVSFVSGAVDTISATTTSEISRVDGDISFVSGAVDTISAVTTSEISRVDGDVSFVSGAVDTVNTVMDSFSSSTVTEFSRIDKNLEDETLLRIANDVTPGIYVLQSDPSSEMVIPTNSEEVSDVKIKVSDDFFNFGEF